MVKIIVALLCCVSLSAAADSCPEPMTELLNLTAYSGRWYPVMKADWPVMNCSFVDYTEENKTTLSVRNSSVGDSNEYETVTGVAVLGEDKHFSVKMDDNNTENYYVLATDYSNYTMVISCDKAQNTTLRALVLCRERNLTVETREVVEDQAKKLNTVTLTPVLQTECPNAAPGAPLLPPLTLLLAAFVARRFL